MSKHSGGQFHTHTNIHTVGLGGNVQITAHALHPLTAAAANGNDTIFTGISRIFAEDLISAIDTSHRLHRHIKEELHFILQIRIQIFQNYIVNIGTQVTHRCIQQMQVVLNTQSLKTSTGCGVQLSTLAAVFHVDLVNILHQIQRLLLTNVFIQSTTKIIGNVIFTIGKGTGAAETTHNRTALTADTALDLIAIDGAATLLQRMACLKYSDLQIAIQLSQFIGSKNTARACTNDDHIILRSLFHFVFVHNLIKKCIHV